MKRALNLLILVVLAAASGPTHTGRAQSGDTTVYLPLISQNQNFNQTAMGRTANAAFVDVPDMAANRLYLMSVMWFGRVTASDNYTDVRLGYNNSELVIHAQTIDRRIWYNPQPGNGALEDWDAVTLLLHTANENPASPGANSYRFVVQYNPLSGTEPAPAQYKATYRGNGSGWSAQAVNFIARTGWRGTGPNSNSDDKGWTITYRIPFASLGLSSRPPDGTVWRMSLISHDRDSQAGPPGTSFTWPENADRSAPSSWGSLRFGIPAFNPPGSSNPQTVMIRQGLNGAQVPDADVGGGSLCGGTNMDYWSYWGDTNFAGHDDLNVQNQADVSDWPCFSKYYVTFPLNNIPAGKVIRSARLVLYQFGGSDPSLANRSYVHVFSVTDDWNEASLTWNNAPLANENISVSIIDVISGPPWPNVARDWDVSRALNQAYQSGQPLRLALYSADTGMHSGKYFRSSDFRDDYHRPALIVEYGNP